MENLSSSDFPEQPPTELPIEMYGTFMTGRHERLGRKDQLSFHVERNQESVHAQCVT